MTSDGVTEQEVGVIYDAADFRALYRARRRCRRGLAWVVLILRTRHPSQDSVFHWSAIRDVVVKGGRLFLFTTPACAIILPRRVFADDHHFAKWTTRADAYWHAAKAGGHAKTATT